jgi:RNA polymerase sigma factor (sigma-70 family)
MSARLRAWFRTAPVARGVSDARASDADLMHRFTDTGDEAAFAELVRRHGPMVLATCRRVLHPDVHTADDAFQASFLVLATRAAAVSPPERVGAFLHGVAVNVARKAKSWARKLAQSDPTDLDRVAGPSIETDPDAAETRAKIDAVLAELPSRYRSPVVLCDLEGRSRTEAAALLGWSEGALSGRLFRARKLLADRLARRGVTVPVVGGLGVLLPASAASAVVPVHLAASTIDTAVLVSTGAAGIGAADGAIPASIAALARGVPTMHSVTFKLFAAGAAGLGLALGGFGLFALTAATPQPPTDRPAARSGAAPVPVEPPRIEPARKGWTTKYTFTHKSAVTALAFGPTFLASGDKNGALILWDTKAGKEKETLVDGTAKGTTAINRLQVSPQGDWLYLVNNDGRGIGQCSVDPKGRQFPGCGSPRAYGVTADGGLWLQADGDRVLRLTQNQFDDNKTPFFNVARFVHKDDIAFAAAEDDEVVATVADGVLRRWKKGDEKPVWEDKLEKFEASALAVCPLTKAIAVGGKNGEVRVYAALTGKVLITLRGHTDPVTAVAFNADGTRIVTGGADRTARLWNAENGRELVVLKGHTDRVTAVGFGPAGEVATGSADKSVRVWSAPDGN